MGVRRGTNALTASDTAATDGSVGNMDEEGPARWVTINSHHALAVPRPSRAGPYVASPAPVFAAPTAPTSTSPVPAMMAVAL